MDCGADLLSGAAFAKDDDAADIEFGSEDCRCLRIDFGPNSDRFNDDGADEVAMAYVPI